jgi:catechol 2,3-dioxygenase-like lactoylglutathione lyase family enzyme
MRAAFISLVLLSCFVAAGAQPSEPARLRWVTLRVGDARSGAQWYARHFDGKAEKRRGVWVTSLEQVELRFVGELPSGDKFERGAIDHLAFADPDVAGRIERLRAAGVKIVQPVQSSSGGDFRYSFVEDPWGGKIEIVSDGQAQGLHHLHLYSKQPDQVLQWWRRELGGRDTEPLGGFEHLRSLEVANVLVVVQQDNGERVRVPSVESRIYDVGWSSESASASSRQAPDGVLVSFERARR